MRSKSHYELGRHPLTIEFMEFFIGEVFELLLCSVRFVKDSTLSSSSNVAMTIVAANGREGIWRGAGEMQYNGRAIHPIDAPIRSAKILLKSFIFPKRENWFRKVNTNENDLFVRGGTRLHSQPLTRAWSYVALYLLLRSKLSWYA